eukprot:13413891-Ditylum_brightwellii.AAC.1
MHEGERVDNCGRAGGQQDCTMCDAGGSTLKARYGNKAAKPCGRQEDHKRCKMHAAAQEDQRKHEEHVLAKASSKGNWRVINKTSKGDQKVINKPPGEIGVT